MCEGLDVQKWQKKKKPGRRCWTAQTMAWELGQS
jgi:hypothetical protein